MKEKNDESVVYQDITINATETFSAEKWKIMVVDDQESVHTVTRLSLKRLVFENKGIELINAYSAAEAKKMLAENPDTAVILLDVVMEEENAGLDLVHFIRKEMGNSIVRIILRTGHPGQAPEESVIIEYDINDYKEKTELTSQKLHTAVVSALRSYRDLSIIDANRRGLQNIIRSSATIYEHQSRMKLAYRVLEQLTDILNLRSHEKDCNVSGFMAAKQESGEFRVLAATKRHSLLAGKKLRGSVPDRLLEGIEEAFQKKRSYFFQDYFIIYTCSKRGSENIICIEGAHPLNEWDRSLIEIFNMNISVAFANIDLNEEVEATQKEIIFTLGEIAEARSLETGYHVKRVAELSRLLALRYGLSSEEAELLRLAAPTHDLGKLAIPDYILNKPGSLTKNEFEIMKTHSEIGYEMLRKSKRPILQAGAVIALQHHERYDGTGYPKGLKGEEIHIYGRIVGLTDVFDALGNDRVYKKAWPLGEIVDYIQRQRGKQFDPQLVDIFLGNLDDILIIRKAFPDRYPDI
ncbi:MAG: DUF3369 domain-containing protein [Bacillota bacterium]